VISVSSQLASTFLENAMAAAATVERCARSRAALRRAIEPLVPHARIIVAGSTEFLPAEILGGFTELPGAINEPSDEQLARADAGITEAFAGVASTGSVCITMGPPLITAASLLMPLHIVVLAAERIVERPRDLFDPACLGGQGLRRDLVYITGPSATADMGPLVRGVHGPHRLHIVLLD
jgi:L-lactate dehydrogenase complex protein LldG